MRESFDDRRGTGNSKDDTMLAAMRELNDHKYTMMIEEQY